jgi:hypothetical protein
MYMGRAQKLLMECILTKVRKTWELEIRDSCLDMLQMNGIRKHYILTRMFFLALFAKKWPSKGKMDLFHG